MPAPKTEVQIASKSYADGVWTADCTVITGGATRMGPHSVELPEDASDAQLKTAIAGLYE